MIIELDLDSATVAQIDTLARRLGIQEVGEDRERKRRSEVVRRLLSLWATLYEHWPARITEPERRKLEADR